MAGIFSHHIIGATPVSHASPSIPPKVTGTSGKIVHKNGYSGLVGKFPERPKTKVEDIFAGLKTKADEILDDKPKPKRRPYVHIDTSGPAPSSHTSAKKTWDYYEAPLAEKYHFGKETAYQEALANTAFRREMSDMRKAGINPSVYYGAHSSSGAESNIYPREQSSGGSSGYGGSGGSGRRYGRGRSNSGKYAFSGGAYYGIMAAAGTIAAVATHNAGVGMAVAGLTGTALKAFNGFLKK